MKRPLTMRTVFGAGLWVCLGIHGVALAQPAPPPPPPPPPPGMAPPPAAAPSPPPPSAAPVAPPSAEPARTPLSLIEVIRTTLRGHPNIQLARAAASGAKAGIGIAKGPFDPLFLASAGHQHDEFPVLVNQRAGPEHRSRIVDTTSLNVGASAETRFGMRLVPNVGLSRIHDRPGESLTFMGMPIPANNFSPFSQANVSLTLIQRLLRGAGTVGAASAIESARRAHNAAAHTVAHTAQGQVASAVTAYYNLVAAGQQVALLRDAQAAAQKLLDDSRTMVEQDARPRSDLRQLEGNLADRTRDVRNAENIELQALYFLQEEMGIGSVDSPYWEPTDGLPAAQPAAMDQVDIVRRARLARRDIKAARETIASAGAALRGAEYNTKAALDLSGNVGYNGAVDGGGAGDFFASAGRNIPGVSGGVALTLELPFNNTFQEAQRDQQRALYDQAKIQASNIDRLVPIDVKSALDNLRLAAAALELSNAAVAQYQQAIKDEQDRVREGAGTVIDVILTQDRFIRAQQNQVNDHAQYAAALAQLRFVMGAMPSREDEAMTAVNGLLGPRTPATGGENAATGQ